MKLSLSLIISAALAESIIPTSFVYSNTTIAPESSIISLDSEVASISEALSIPTPYESDIDSISASDIDSTASDIISTASDIDSAASDIISTASDIISTATDIISTASDIDSAASDIISTASDIDSAASDIISTASDITPTASDIISTATDIISTATDIESTSTASALNSLAGDAEEASEAEASASASSKSKLRVTRTNTNTAYNTDITKATRTICNDNGCYLTTDIIRKTTYTEYVDGVLTTFVSEYTDFDFTATDDEPVSVTAFPTVIPSVDGKPTGDITTTIRTKITDDVYETEFGTTIITIQAPKSTDDVTATITSTGTTIITVTSCSDDKCSLVPVETGVIYVTNDYTTYTTFCPLTEEESSIEVSTPTTIKDVSTYEELTSTVIGTTIVTITSCSDNKCSATPVTTGVVVVTENDTIYTTYCPLPETEAPIETSEAPITVTPIETIETPIESTEIPIESTVIEQTTEIITSTTPTPEETIEVSSIPTIIPTSATINVIENITTELPYSSSTANSTILPISVYEGSGAIHKTGFLGFAMMVVMALF